MRSKEVDIAKGLCIIIMITVHAMSWWGRHEWINLYTCPFFLPFFFFASGFFFKEPDSILEYILKRLKRLVLPYAVVAISILIYRNMTGFKNMRILIDSLIYALPADFTKEQLIAGAGTIGIGPVWFLNCLFVCNCMYLFLRKIKRPLRWIIILCMSVAANITQRYFVLPLNLQDAAIGLIYFEAGRCLYPYIYRGIECGRKHIQQLILILIGTFVIYFADIRYVPNQWIDLGTNRFSFEALIGSVLGFTITLGVSVLISRISILNEIIEFVGRNSMVILVLHTIDMAYLRHWSDMNGLFFLLTFVFYIGISYVYIEVKTAIRRSSK